MKENRQWGLVGTRWWCILIWECEAYLVRNPGLLALSDECRLGDGRLEALKGLGVESLLELALVTSLHSLHNAPCHSEFPQDPISKSLNPPPPNISLSSASTTSGTYKKIYNPYLSTSDNSLHLSLMRLHQRLEFLNHRPQQSKPVVFGQDLQKVSNVLVCTNKFLELSDDSALGLLVKGGGRNDPVELLVLLEGDFELLEVLVDGVKGVGFSGGSVLFPGVSEWCN